MREIREETGLYIIPQNPLSVRHFKRDDDQIITMITFFCKPNRGYLKISKEHSEIKWQELDNVKEDLTEFFHKEIDILNQLNTKSKS